jgi:hypothetical protein
VFGVVFSRGDFADDVVPDEFSPNQAEERLSETGNRLIAEARDWPDE